MPQNETPGASDPSGPPQKPLVVGTINHHYYQWDAIGVVVEAGQTILHGSKLRRLDLDPDDPKAIIRADSIQLNHANVPAGESGQEIGIGMEPPFPPKGTKLVLA